MQPPDRPRHVTLKDVAQALGISLGTVSMAMRDDPRITKARRQQVKETAREMGYRPNAMATALARFKKQSQLKPVQAVLAWINAWPDPKKMRTYREFDLYWHGAVKAAEKFGFRLEEFVVSKELPLRRMQSVFRARNIRGILIAPLFEEGAGVD